MKLTAAIAAGLVAVASPQETGHAVLQNASVELVLPQLPRTLVYDERCAGFRENQIAPIEGGAVCINNLLILPGAAP